MKQTHVDLNQRSEDVVTGCQEMYTGNLQYDVQSTCTSQEGWDQAGAESQDAKQLSRGIQFAVVDAFTDRPFSGNPAAVLVLPRWPVEQCGAPSWLQQMAREFNQPMTSFLVKRDLAKQNDYELRHFTPSGAEISICGHATLAAAHYLWSYHFIGSDVIWFQTAEGTVSASRKVTEGSNNDERLTDVGPIELDFPIIPTPFDAQQDRLLYGKVASALRTQNIKAIRRTRLYLLVELTDAASVVDLAPDFQELAILSGRGTIVTARATEAVDGRHVDVINRMFCPATGVPEDPVCGSALCAAGPYWARQLGKDVLQASSRGGHIKVQVDWERDRVFLEGTCIVNFTGTLRDAQTAFGKRPGLAPGQGDQGLVSRSLSLTAL